MACGRLTLHGAAGSTKRQHGDRAASTVACCAAGALPSRGLAKAAALKRKVAVLDEAERQRRIRQAAQGAQAQQPGAAPPDMSRLLQQVNEPHAEEQRQHQSTGEVGAGFWAHVGCGASRARARGC